MNEENLLNLIKQSPQVLKLIYVDLAQPGVRKIGQALETVLDLSNTILLPVKLLNEKTRVIFKNNIKKYRERIENIPDDKICDVPPEIGTPILEKLTYVRDEDISDLFVNLLAKASSIDTINQAHPSFISRINNLSGDEAKIIHHLSENNNIAFITIIAKRKDGKGERDIYKITDLPTTIGITFRANIVTYLDNLASLGLLICHEGKYLIADSHYNQLISAFENKVVPESKDISDKGDYNLTYKKGVYQITDYGMMFIKACTLKIKTQINKESDRSQQ